MAWNGGRKETIKMVPRFQVARNPILKGWGQLALSILEHWRPCLIRIEQLDSPGYLERVRP
jgi:hypothetical protein